MATPATPDLRILWLADSKKLPDAVQQAFDHFRIQAARTAVSALIRRRGAAIPEWIKEMDALDALTDDNAILKFMATFIDALDEHRANTGLHRDYVLLVMSQHLNPWGVVDFQRDFNNPMPYVREAAAKLWALCKEHQVAVESLLAKSRDPLMNALTIHYLGADGMTKPLKPLEADPEDSD
jgi:hypothetical protein